MNYNFIVIVFLYEFLYCFYPPSEHPLSNFEHFHNAYFILNR